MEGISNERKCAHGLIDLQYELNCQVEQAAGNPSQIVYSARL